MSSAGRGIEVSQGTPQLYRLGVALGALLAILSFESAFILFW
jgi:hypothetical protein